MQNYYIYTYSNFHATTYFQHPAVNCFSYPSLVLLILFSYPLSVCSAVSPPRNNHHFPVCPAVQPRGHLTTCFPPFCSFSDG